MGRHRGVDEARDGHRLGVEEELAFLGSGHHLEVVDQPAEAVALLGQGGDSLLVYRQYALSYRLDGRADRGDRGPELVSELAGELTPGLLGGLQPMGELVDRCRERGELGAHAGVHDPSVEPPVGKAAGDIGSVRDRGRESLRNQPADGGRGDPRDEDAHAESDEDRLVEGAGDMLLHQLVRRQPDTVEVGLEDGWADQQGRDQDRAGPCQDHQQVVDQ